MPLTLPYFTPTQPTCAQTSNAWRGDALRWTATCTSSGVARCPLPQKNLTYSLLSSLRGAPFGSPGAPTWSSGGL
eukprot:6053086-Prymnesium_polylepis.1